MFDIGAKEVQIKMNFAEANNLEEDVNRLPVVDLGSGFPALPSLIFQTTPRPAGRRRREISGAFHLSELASQSCQFVNGIYQFEG